MCEDERLAEIAAIFARGVLRLKQRAVLPDKLSADRLEVSRNTVLSVHTGLRGETPETKEKR
jgi:hypothetical protein